MDVSSSLELYTERPPYSEKEFSSVHNEVSFHLVAYTFQLSVSIIALNNHQGTHVFCCS